MLEEAIALVRTRVPRYTRDRFFAPDIAAAKEIVWSGAFRGWMSDITLKA